MSAPWLEILSRPIAFHPIFVTLTGSVNAALMLSQGMYWAKRTKDPEGWFYKTEAQWQSETYLTRREQQGARKLLRDCGFWHEKRRGNPAHLYYRIDLADLEYKLVHLNSKPRKKGQRQVQQDAPDGATESTEAPNKLHPTGQLLNKEITTETTSETSNNVEAALRAARVADIGRMMSALNKKIGPIPNPPAQASAARWLLEAGYDVETCLACLDALSEEKWRTSAVTWLTVKNQIGAWSKKNERVQTDSASNNGQILRKGINE